MEMHCKIEGCKRPYKAKGYCKAHYGKWRKGELPKPRYKICSKEDCKKPSVLMGLCKEHSDIVLGERAKKSAAMTPKEETKAAQTEQKEPVQSINADSAQEKQTGGE